MKDKIKQLFNQFAEDFDLTSFFCITIVYYKDPNHLGIKGLGGYSYELDMYLMSLDFEYEYDKVYNWYKYKKDNVEIVLMHRYK